jgi:hypothetical protein
MLLVNRALSVLAPRFVLSHRRDRIAAPACANVAENPRLFVGPQETGFAQDCVVGLVGLKLTTERQ